MRKIIKNKKTILSALVVLGLIFSGFAFQSARAVVSEEETPNGNGNGYIKEPDIPTYEDLGSEECETGFYEKIGSYEIESDDPDGTYFHLEEGIYRFKASGTYSFRHQEPDWWADAAHSTKDNWESTAEEYGIYGTPPDLGAHALLANLGEDVGIVDWGDDNSDHEYDFYYQVDEGTVRFLIGDRYGDWFDTPWQNQTAMDDNEGSLSLEVYRCSDPITLKATKIVCDSLEDLPKMSGGSDITENTADEFMEGKEEVCRIESDWEFEWKEGQVNNPGDNEIGPTNNWNLFDASDYTYIDVEPGKTISVREVMKEGYLPFSEDLQDDNSAEFYCADDVLNYDNLEYIKNLQSGKSYYCVAFNVIEEYEVTFMDGDNEYTTKKVQHGNSLDERMPEDPNKDGFIFLGWSTDQENGDSFDSKSKVTEDMTVYALWEEDPQEETTTQRRRSGQRVMPLPTTQGEDDDPEEDLDEEGGVLGEADEREEVLGEADEEWCDIYLKEHLRYGEDNDSMEVKKLQLFLNMHMGEDLDLDGHFGKETEEAVNRFQLRYKDEILAPWTEVGVHSSEDEPTGFVYKTTKRWINMLMCPELNIPMPELSGYQAVYHGEQTEQDQDGLVLGEEDYREEIDEEAVESEYPDEYDEEDEEMEENDLDDELDEDIIDEDNQIDEEDETEEGPEVFYLILAIIILGGLFYYIFKKTS